MRSSGGRWGCEVGGFDQPGQLSNVPAIVIVALELTYPSWAEAKCVTVPSILVASHSPSMPFALVTLKSMVTSEVTWWPLHVAKNRPLSLPVYLAPLRFSVAFSEPSDRSDHVTSHPSDLHLGLKCHPAVKWGSTAWNPVEDLMVKLTLKSPASLASATGGLGVVTDTETNSVSSVPPLAFSSYVYFFPGVTPPSL